MPFSLVAGVIGDAIGAIGSVAGVIGDAVVSGVGAIADAVVSGATAVGDAIGIGTTAGGDAMGIGGDVANAEKGALAGAGTAGAAGSVGAAGEAGAAGAAGAETAATPALAPGAVQAGENAGGLASTNAALTKDATINAAGAGTADAGASTADAGAGGADLGNAAKVAGGKAAPGAGGILGTGISSTQGSLLLGALAAGGKMLTGSGAAPAQVGPSSVNNGPYWNAPLNTNAPGRTAVNPFASQGSSASAPPQAPPQTPSQSVPSSQPSNYWTYGGPEQTFFQGNSLTSTGWPGQVAPTQTPTQMPSSSTPANPTGLARGGALNRNLEFRTGSGNHRVMGPGTETSDSIPAMLSNHEYVLDAQDMREIGGGDPVRGADRLDRDRRKLARGRGVLAQFASNGRA